MPDKKPKEIAAQISVHTRGKVTTVKPTGSGKTTIARMDVFFDEILSSAAVPEPLRLNARQSKGAFDNLIRALEATPVAGTTERAAS